MTDPTVWSTVSPSAGSTYVNSISSTDPTSFGKESSTVDLADGNGLASSPATTTGPQNTVLQRELTPSIPVRSSSNPNKPSSNELSTSPASGQVADEAQIARSESKGSIREKRRSRSVASSTQSRKARRILPDTTSHPTGATDTQSGEIVERPRKRGVSRFFSFLNCCSSTEDAKTLESSDQAVPANKTKIIPPKSASQTVPVGKNAAASIPGDSDEVIDRHTADSPYSKLPPATTPKMVNEVSKETITTEKPVIQDDAGVGFPEKEKYNDTVDGDQIMPNRHVPNNAAAQDDLLVQSQPSIPSTVVNVEPHDSSKAIPSSSAIQEDIPTNNQPPPPAKGNSDVAMADAPPIIPVSLETPKRVEGGEEGQTPVSWPPPPPPSRNAQTHGNPANVSSVSNAVTSNEKQQWLLPPLQPRFKGKKCLVLDLDETLVHSSFKV